MKPLEGLIQNVGSRTVFMAIATTSLALLSAAERRPGSIGEPASAGIVATAAPADNAATGQTSTGAHVAPPDRSAREVRGATPYAAIENEPPPKLIVDPPLPDLLARGVVWIQWPVENVHIVPVFGKGALNASPRVGHLHVRVDDLPWWWADASDINTIDLAGMPPGQHKVRIDLVDAQSSGLPGQSRTVTFTVPQGASPSHSH